MKWLQAGIAACIVIFMGAESEATELLVGLNPPDGATALAKRFHVTAGTTVVGATIGNNDPRTVFPEVLLVRSAGRTLSEGVVVASATIVEESSPGQSAVIWDPISVTEDGDYLVVVRFPRGSRKQGPGDGAALRASAAASEHSSYIAGSDGSLNEVSVDLHISLLTGNAVAGKASPDSRDYQAPIPRTFLARTGGSPASAVVGIRFGLERPSFIELSIYDIAGREVRNLLREDLGAGEHAVNWDGRDSQGQDVAAGVYFARLRTNQKTLTQKMVLVK